LNLDYTVSEFFRVNFFSVADNFKLQGTDVGEPFPWESGDR